VDASIDRAVAAIKHPDAGLAEVNRALEQVRPLPEQFRATLATLAADPREVPTLVKARCECLLRLQAELAGGAARLEKAVAARPDKKPDRADAQTTTRLSDRAAEIEREISALARHLEEKAPKSPHREPLRALAGAVRDVQGRLAKGDVGADTRSRTGRLGAKLQETLAATCQDTPRDLSAERQSREGEELGRLTELAALKLDAERARLEEVLAKVRAAGRAAESREANFPAEARRVGEAEKTVRKAAEVLREVRADVAAAARGFSEKKAVAGLTARLDRRVEKPLGRAVDEDLPAALTAQADFRAALEAGRFDADKAKRAGESTARLFDRVRGAGDALRYSPDVSDLIVALSEIEWEEREVVKRLRELAGKLEDDLLK
jgi:hypothetical protein